MIEHLDNTLRSILKQYHAEHDLSLVPVQVDLLKPMFEQRGYADRIVWEAYDYPDKNIAAQVSFYKAAMGLYSGEGDYARIQYSGHLNLCWQRFAVCKEMFHCILDDGDEARTSSISDLMKLSELLVSGAASRLAQFKPHSTEQDAEILALETLFPLELRLSHREEYDEGLITDYQLALRYRIPEEYARMGMYEHYLTMIQNLRGELVEI